MKKISINNLYALCCIIGEYDMFNNKILNILSRGHVTHKLYKLQKISNGFFVLGSKKLKNFYQENKEIIDNINYFSSLWNFIIFNYNVNTNKIENGTLYFFYNYILKHKDKFDQIIDLLQKIEKLGFQELELDEAEKFINKDYEIDIDFKKNNEIPYFNNIEYIPNYQNNIIRYRTKNSNYMMCLKRINDKISNGGNNIIVRNLFFDINDLPEIITKENTFDQIIIKDNQSINNKIIKNSLDLSVCIDDLYNQYNITNQIIDSFDNIHCKHELLVIKEKLDSLKKLSMEYDKKICNDINISEEVIKCEKKLYLEKRNKL